MLSKIYKITEKHREALRKAALKDGRRPPSRLGIPNSPEQRARISIALKGKKKTPEAVAKSAASKTGQKRTKEFCEKMRLQSLGRKGEKAGNWKGGITPYYRVLRVARLKAVGGSHTKEEWETLLAQYNWTCPCCKKSDVKLTKDHIIPVVKGGSDNIENIQPLCGSCNSKKMMKIIKYELVVKKI